MSKKRKIAILGTRGIPNQYGGFEALAEKLSVFLVEQGHEVFVYQTHNHPYADNQFRGVKLVHCYNPEVWLGTFGQFGYDLLCQLDAQKRNFDVWLHLGYTSNTVWGRYWPKGVLHISNMDGLEWKRSKYNPLVQRFLKWAEKKAVIHSDKLVADHPVIQSYLKNVYNADSKMIRYGAGFINPLKPNVDLPDSFDLVMARMEPENNVLMALESQLHTKRPLVIAGNIATRYARKLTKRFPNGKKVYWIGGVYNPSEAEWLRKNCVYYIHGHSVGGTNPSLVQAMATGCRIIAHDNAFSREILGEKAVGYYANNNQLAALRRTQSDGEVQFAVPSWKDICEAYESLILNH